MQSDINNVKNPRLFKMLEKTMMYNFDVQYKPGKEMVVADFGSRSPRQEEAHEDFISRNNEIGITVKSLRVRQLDVADPKLEQLAAIGAEDPDYQMMINHIERGIQENLPEENSELLQLKVDFVNLGLQTFSKGKFIVKMGVTS